MIECYAFSAHTAWHAFSVYLQTWACALPFSVVGILMPRIHWDISPTAPEQMDDEYVAP